jgi:uncharacterized protein YndB with AHSA1/START domain
MSTKITVSVLVNAPIETVWECWTNPEHIKKWNFASDDWHCPFAENDLKIGGKNHTRMEAKDGSFGFDFILIYDQIVEHHEISCTMEDGRKSTTLFESDGDETKVSTTFDAENENPTEMQQFGWQAILNNFKNHAKSI